MNAFEDALKFERLMIKMVKAFDSLWFRGDFERRLACVSDLDDHINQLEVVLGVLRQERARRKKRQTAIWRKRAKAGRSHPVYTSERRDLAACRKLL